MRDCIDDARHLALIERLVTEGRGDEVARARAKEFLAHLRHTIPLDANGFRPDSKTFPRDPTGRPPLPISQLKPRLADAIKQLAP